VRRPGHPACLIELNPTWRSLMMFGTNLFFIALGAILKYAVSWTVVGIDLHTVGVILIAVGLVGLALNAIVLLRARDDGMPREGF
jgi:hypothetical protein